MTVNATATTLFRASKNWLSSRAMPDYMRIGRKTSMDVQEDHETDTNNDEADEHVPCIQEDKSYKQAGTERIRGTAFLPRMNLAAMLLTIALVAASIFATMRWERGGSNAPRFRPQWSPMYDRFSIPIVEKTLDPFIPWRPDHPEQIYSRDPAPEVDAAWEKISHSMTWIPLTPEDAVRMGKDPEALIQLPGDDVRYLSTQDTLHQLHCLNYLRKGLIHNYHYYWGKKWGFWPPFSLIRHLTHCLDILRQHLMCNADMELYTYNWRVGETIKWPDFGVRKTCRDFDALLAYLQESQQPDLVAIYRNITKPADANELPVPLGVQEYITDETYINDAGTYLNPIPGLGDKDYCLGS